jgi:predicted nucleotidyltransferase
MVKFSDMFESEIRPIKSRLIAAGVQRLGVFGSFGRGEAVKDSDVDVLVRFDDTARTFDNLYAVAEALEEVFQRRVDLVTEDALSPYLRPHILKDVKYVDLAS